MPYKPRKLLVYVPDEAWLIQRAVAKGHCDADDEWGIGISKHYVIDDVIIETGLLLETDIFLVFYKGKVRHALGLASDRKKDKWPVPPQEDIERVKNVLGVTEEPIWLDEWR